MASTRLLRTLPLDFDTTKADLKLIEGIVVEHNELRFFVSL